MAQQQAMQNLQNQNVENGYPEHEEIPLNRLNSSEERAERRRMRQIFNMVYFLIIFFFCLISCAIGIFFFL